MLPNFADVCTWKIEVDQRLIQRYLLSYGCFISGQLLTDLTVATQYDLYSHELLFHHVSFLDYLLNQPMSNNWFVDTAAFDYLILLKI